MSSSKIVFITGANTGLGFQMVRALSGSDQSYEILLGGRSLPKAQQAAEDVRAEFPQSASKISPIQIDIEDDSSVEAAVNEIKTKHGRLDALVNNAGVQLGQHLTAGTMTMREVWTRDYAVNTVGTQILTHALVPLLLASADPRLLFMASGTSSLAIAENHALPFNRLSPAGWPKEEIALNNLSAYRGAKAGMNMMMLEWHRTLKNDGVKVWALSPGFLATGLGGSAEANKKHGGGDPTLAGPFVRDVLEGKRDADVGKVILREGVQPW